jgi:hypothetical protein
MVWLDGQELEAWLIRTKQMKIDALAYEKTYKLFERKT